MIQVHKKCAGTRKDAINRLQRHHVRPRRHRVACSRPDCGSSSTASVSAIGSEDRQWTPASGTTLLCESDISQLNEKVTWDEHSLMVNGNRTIVLSGEVSSWVEVEDDMLTVDRLVSSVEVVLHLSANLS